jgi:hypothetical protein
MKKFSSVLALVVGLLSAIPAHAASAPDYITAGLGMYDFDKGGDRNSTDYRMEYQWGTSLLPMVNHDWAYLDKSLLLHPVVGFEGNGSGMTFFNGGANLDVPVVSHIMFTLGETIGWYGHGNDHQTLGSPFEMRTQLELGWTFQNDMRLSAYLSHLSNFGVGDHNPGAETLGAYLRLPVSWLAHK